MSYLTPFGVNDLIPSEATQYAALIDRLSATFASSGYQEVRTPSLEFFDSLEPGMGPALKKSAIKFIGPNDQLFVLRPDHTTPIARMVATRMHDHPLPLKLSYFNSVFRHMTGDIRQDMETFQAGCEYIGENTAASDAAVILTCLDALRAIGLSDLYLNIGHVDFAANLSDEQRDALLKGDFATFGQIPVRGDVSVVQDFPRLVEIDTHLHANEPHATISYNTGLIKQISYYTGMVFEVYAKGIRQPVASGGRYDDLLEKFGFPCPAVGFGINVSTLFQSGIHP